MPQERLPMRKIRDVLRLKSAGMSKRLITESVGISRTAAGDCIRRAEPSMRKDEEAAGATEETPTETPSKSAKGARK